MFRNVKLRKRIKRLHQRCLRILQWQVIFLWRTVRKRSFCFNNHYGLQTLAVEMFKVFKDVSPQLMAKVFPFKDSAPYNLQQVSHFETWSVRTEYFGRQSLIYIDPNIRELVPSKLETRSNLEIITGFKRAM